LSSTASGGGSEANWDGERSLPQPELSVAGGIGVPVGEGGEEALEEGALEHVGREGWLGHDGRCRWRMMFLRCGRDLVVSLRRRRRGLAMARAKESFRMDFESRLDRGRRGFSLVVDGGDLGDVLR
jgi:hypothetical protein